MIVDRHRFLYELLIILILNMNPINTPFTNKENEQVEHKYKELLKKLDKRIVLIKDEIPNNYKTAPDSRKRYQSLDNNDVKSP
jgi:hypothetical protein